MGGRATPVRLSEDSAAKTTEISAIEPDESRRKVILLAAELYGRGYRRRQIAKALGKRLIPGQTALDRNEEVRFAVRKLIQLEKQDYFRDLVFEASVRELDRATPAILKGVANKAKRGRVDAARLSLEVTGRHNPKGEQNVTSVTVQIAHIPRPESPGSDQPVVEGRAIRPGGE